MNCLFIKCKYVLTFVSECVCVEKSNVTIRLVCVSELNLLGVARAVCA